MMTSLTRLKLFPLVSQTGLVSNSDRVFFISLSPWERAGERA